MSFMRVSIILQTIIFILFFINVQHAVALDQGDLLFYASFNDGFDADIARGSAKATDAGKVKLVSGRNGGKAARFVSRGDYLSYAVDKNINLPQGTICFWLKELDTSDTQRVLNPYFRLLGRQEDFMVGRLWQPVNIAGGLWRNDEKAALALSPVGKKDKWCHIAFSWRGHEMRIFFNGKPAENCKCDLQFIDDFREFTLGRPKNPDAGIDTFHSGMHMWKDAAKEAKRQKIGKEPYGAFLMDDFMIFSRFMDGKEIEAIKDMPLTEALKVPAGESRLSFDYSSRNRIIRVDLQFGLRLPPDAKIQVELLESNGKPTGISDVPQMKPSGVEYAKLDVSKLKRGKYKIVAAALAGKKCLTRLTSQEFELDPSPEWLTNTYGAEDVVLYGFEPLSVRGNRVILWGREYDFTDSIMPKSIVNQGNEMLTRPICWKAKVNGKSVELKTEGMKLISSKDTRANFEGIGSLDGLRVCAKVMVEYDGFAKFDITFDPGDKSVSVDSLEMEIPFAPQESSNFYYSCRNKGMWPEKWNSSLLKLNSVGVITIGTPDICLQWITESDQYYYPRGYEKALETVTTPKEHIFKTNVIGKSKKIDKPFTLTFALQAGPVKARPKNWRGWTKNGRKYLDPQKHTSIAFKYDWWARAPGEPIPRKGFPAKPDSELFKGDIRMCSTHFAGFRTFDEPDADKRSPEWGLHELEWKRIPVLMTYGKAPGWGDIYVDTNSTWGQWHIYNVHKLFELTGIRGLYYDDWQPGVSTNELAGSGYVDENGIRRPTYPIFSQREIHRRIYSIVHKSRPEDGIVMIHLSGTSILPIISFCDVIYDGEILVWIQNCPPDGDYFETYRDELFQAMLSCKQYGPVPFFHDVTRIHSKQKKCGGKIFLMKNQRKLWAKLLLHDIHAMSAFTSGSEDLLYFWLDYFDIADPQVKFHSYWAKNPAVKVVGLKWEKTGKPEKLSDVKAVAYSKPDKTLVVIVVDGPNNYLGEIVAEIKIDRKKLGLPEGELLCTDLESLGRSPLGHIEGDILKVPVKFDDFTAVILKKTEK